MLTAAQTFAFLLAAVLLTATPGPDNLMVLSIGMSRGRRPGIAFGLGCAIGCLSHTVLAVVGVSALVAASPTAFTLLRWLGGGYLVWLGIGALRSAGIGRVGPAAAESTSLTRLFLKGLLANAVNPKVVLFFLSFLPQFVMPAQGRVEGQLALLGIVFTLQAALLFSLLGYFSGSVGAWLNRTPRAGQWLDRLAGTVFIALGLRLVSGR
jgi:threonine/homoserine/homoserine lactone efflux protein